MMANGRGPLVEPMEAFEEEESPLQPDWQVPLTFMRARHVSLLEERETAAVNSDSWRVKDRVGYRSRNKTLFKNLGILYR